MNEEWVPRVIRKTASIGRYTFAVVPEHPRKYEHDYVLEHVIVMENHLKRLLMEGEIVHHIDNNGKNNEIENLELKSKSKHTIHHKFLRNDYGRKMFMFRCPNCLKICIRQKIHKTSYRYGKGLDFCSRNCSGEYYPRLRKYNLLRDQLAAKINFVKEFKQITEENYSKYTLRMGESHDTVNPGSIPAGPTMPMGLR